MTDARDKYPEGRADQRRREWIGKLLELAAADPYAEIGTWEDLVKIAKEYGGRAVPRPADAEFEPYRRAYASLPGRNEIRLEAGDSSAFANCARAAGNSKRTFVTDETGRRIAAVVPAWLAGSGSWACGCPATSTGEHRADCPRYATRSLQVMAHYLETSPSRTVSLPDSDTPRPLTVTDRSPMRKQRPEPGWSAGLLTLGDLRARLTEAGSRDWDLSTSREGLEEALEAAEAEKPGCGERAPSGKYVCTRHRNGWHMATLGGTDGALRVAGKATVLESWPVEAGTDGNS